MVTDDRTELRPDLDSDCGRGEVTRQGPGGGGLVKHHDIMGTSERGLRSARKGQFSASFSLHSLPNKAIFRQALMRLISSGASGKWLKLFLLRGFYLLPVSKL